MVRQRSTIPSETSRCHVRHRVVDAAANTNCNMDVWRVLVRARLVDNYVLSRKVELSKKSELQTSYRSDCCPSVMTCDLSSKASYENPRR